MDNTKNPHNPEAIKKLKKLAENIKTCMFCTELNAIPFETRPMITQQVDENGIFWFLSADESHKNTEIKNDDNVQLIYSNSNDSHYLSVFGTASISKDQNKINELWNDFSKEWFNKGKSDPAITLISVKPISACYWDVQTDKMTSLLEIVEPAAHS